MMSDEEVREMLDKSRREQAEAAREFYLQLGWPQAYILDDPADYMDDAPDLDKPAVPSSTEADPLP